MNRRSCSCLRLIAFIACTVLSFSTASAHFLFVRVGPLGEGGRRAEVFFSEKADAGDPMFIGKLTGTRLWRQSQPGSFVEIPVRPASDRLVAPLPGSGSVGVVGICEYGVRAVAGRTPFLLRYYPKAVAGTAAEVNALKPRTEIPFEITARFGNDHVEFTVFAEGKPVPGAKLTTVDLDLVNETLITDAEGRVRWKPSRGEYSVYTDRTVKTPGESNGSKYAEIREFATIAFRFPLEREGVDAEAVSAFETAVAARAQWVDFPGFRASISGVIDGRDFSGKVDVPAEGKAKLEIDDSAHASWIIDQLSSIVLHRRAESSRSAQGRPTLRYADEDEIHPLGRLLEFEGGRFASTYRILDGRISTVNRDLGGSAMTILTLETSKNAEGKDLPKNYIVQYWNGETGDLTKSETVVDAWVRVGAFDLPASHVVTTATRNGLSVRSIRLDDIALKESAR